MSTDFISPSVSHFNCTQQPEKVIRNFFNLSQYQCRHSFFDENAPPLTVGVGYAIVLAFGLTFGIATVFLVFLDQYFFRRTMNSEYFNTAGRSVRTGLTAAVIVSQWTWAATLLQSSNVAFLYGVSGPLWYAAGAAVQVVLFSMLAVLVKLRAPTAHTFLEIVRARWGTSAHIVFLVFALVTNVIVTSMLVLGGSSTVQALTGMNINVACVLIPIGVVLYTLAGGLKATFVASYFNTAIIFVALVIFMFTVYVTSTDLGSSDKVFENLQTVAKIQPVEGNLDGSYLTMLSRNGFFFGMVNLVGNFGTVFIDQSYWQSAIAATPSASWKGYILGGLCWFAIPFSLATALGLAAVALSLPLTNEEAKAGLVPPATAIHLMGNGGAVLVVIMLFMAVTSSGASEQIAVSSVIAYDIYRTYINPNCSGSTVIMISRIVILVFGVLMGVCGIILHQISVDLDFLYRSMGVFIGPAVVPVAFAICWGKASGKGAITGSVAGLLCGVGVWLGYASRFVTEQVPFGKETLEKDEVVLAGNLVSILSSGVICTIMSLIWPDECDWSTTRAIPLIEDDPNAHIPFEEEELLEKALKRIAAVGAVVTSLLFIVWPTMTLPLRVFSAGYFKFWIILAFVWGCFSCGLMIILPLVESRHGILVVLSAGRLARKMKGGNAEEESVEDFVIEER